MFSPESKISSDSVLEQVDLDAVMLLVNDAGVDVDRSAGI